jgi:hypothetical protein
MAEPGGLTFLFDENMPHRLATAMRTLMGERTTHVYDHFGRCGVRDPEMLRLAGEKGWFLVSRDRRILRRASERAVIEEFGMGAFFLKDSLDDFCSIVRAMIHNWPEIKRLADARDRPFVFLIRERGVVRLENRHIR